MKKLTLLLIVATVILFASCNQKKTQADVGIVSPEENLITFKFTPYIIEPIRGDMSNFNRIDMWLIEGDNVYDYHQVKADAGASFGTMYVALNRTKTYTLYSVAHCTNEAATLTDGVISFANDAVTSSAYFTTTFTPETTTTVNCVMQRIIGQFRLCVTDDLPDNFDHITLEFSETGTRLNVNGTATNKIERSQTFTEFYTTPSPKYVGSYLMADDLENTTYITVTATAYDENDDVIETKTFTEVPLKDGYRTIYTGAFFTTTGVNFQFSVEDWNSFNDHPY